MKKRENSYVIMLIAIIALITIVSFYAYAYNSYEVNFSKWYLNANGTEKISPHEALASTGDFLGGTLNPLLSFFSFIAILYSIHLQRKSSREISDAAEVDKFEKTFFELITQLNNTIPENNFLEKKLEEALKNHHLARVRASVHKDNNIYGHYYRLIFQILKFIANKTPGSNYKEKHSRPSAQERFYAGILRSLLNHAHTQILAINSCCLSEKDSFFEYMILIKRYSLLEHMPFEIRTDDIHLKNNSKIYFSSIFYIYRADAFNRSDFLKNHLKKETTYIKKGKVSAYHAMRYAKSKNSTLEKNERISPTNT